MTQGVLIFAFNNEETDYLAMAEWSADNIRRHLNLPVSVVTNAKYTGTAFDHVILADAESGGTRYFEDYNSTVTWHNAGRVDAYNLTPYAQTIVLDADYVVASNNLKRLLNASQDFLCHRIAFDMAGQTDMRGLNSFGKYDMPMWWATVMMFRKSNTAQYIFDSMQMVRDNWQHYRDLYNIDRATYRNDFALSIALGIVSGHTMKVDEIPWALASVMPNTKLLRNLDLDSYTIEYTDSDQKLKHMGFEGLDFHAMGKKHLGDIVETDRRTRLPNSSH
jgi:uncharacterized protein YbcV (DUF1398 family)